MVLFVILKCNSNLFVFKKSIVPHCQLRVLIKQKEIQDQCSHWKLFPGFRVCFFFIFKKFFTGRTTYMGGGKVSDPLVAEP